MNLHWIDWSIMGLLVAFMLLAVRKTKGHVRGVADYLAANRCAGRYLLSVADTMALIGAITIIASFEAYYRAGFTFSWWGMLGGIMFIVALSGWVQYRFRETRALTMAQFLEMRYSKGFRIFFGIQAFFAGVTSFGIFPAVGGRFFMHFCGFRSIPLDLGFITIDLTLAAIMAVLLIISLYFTFAGGQVAVILTDFIQGTFANIAFMAVLLFILIKIPWPMIYETLSTQPPGESMIDPFDAQKIEKFNMWFFIIHIIAQIWFYMSWQGNQGYNASALNAHEARMAKAMGVWRMSMQGVPFMIVAVGAYVIMHHPEWAGLATTVSAALDTVNTDATDTIRQQVTTSVVMSQFLPIGLVGAFSAVMLASFISTHDTCLHSWGSIFIQDVVLPFRKTRLQPQEHLRWLRYAAVGVAVWVFLFSLLFAQYDAIFMFFALVSILGAGAGSVIVFGLYWKRGTTAAAYSSMLVGVAGFFICFALQKLWPKYHDGTEFPINSQILMFIAMLVTIAVYVLVVLLGKKQVYDMDRLLHRGKYAVREDAGEVTARPVRGWQAVFGMTKEFTRVDKIIYCGFGAWSIFWFAFFCVVVTLRQFIDIPDTWWSGYWKFSTWMNVILAIITIVWFTWGGLKDLKTMFHRLETMARDANDDGEVGLPPPVAEEPAAPQHTPANSAVVATTQDPS